MKNPEEIFEKKIAFVIKGNHTRNTRNNAAIGREIICTYYLNEEKGLQE